MKVWFIVIAAFLLLLYLIAAQGIFNSSAAVVSQKSSLVLSMTPVNPNVKILAAEPSNKLVLQINASTSTGLPASKVKIKFNITGGGSITPSGVTTDKSGQCLVSYVPPLLKPDVFKNGNKNVEIKASVSGTDASFTLKFSLTNVPVVFVHGYLASGAVFDNMKDYLAAKGIKGEAITYASDKGAVSSAKELGSFLDQQKLKYLSAGIQVKKFNIIAHSMGGLVVRYYSCSSSYINQDNIQKIIFLSVPHKGSPWASIGQIYYNDQGIRDLVPDSNFLSQLLPDTINKGLNSKIQTGNILDQYDEVVDPESASLEEWGIQTEMYNIGGNNFSMSNLLNGNLADAANHKGILSNKRVFDRIYNMLDSQLPYPQKAK
ncbi:MAG: alpha/beta hydrolase [Bacillota bacterium]|nr:alpha/beta hydrolase [Bacillota bacterium]